MAFESTSLLLLGLLAPALLWVLRYSLADSPRMQISLSALVRCMVMLLLVAALAGALSVRRSRDLAVLVLADLSGSVPASAPNQVLAFMKELTAALPPGSLAGLDVFAEQVETAVPLSQSPALPETLVVPETRATTDLAAALRRAQEVLPAEYVRRVVLLTDGNETHGDALAAAASLRRRIGERKRDGDLAVGPGAGSETLAQRGIAVYALPYERAAQSEVLLEDLDAPSEVKSGQSFTVRAVAHATLPCSATFTLYRDGFKIQEQTLDLTEGPNELLFHETEPPDGLVNYTLRVAAKEDYYADNNVASATVSIAGEARVLLLESDEREGRYLARALEVEGIRVEVRGARGMPGTLAELAAYDAVIFSDVPATDVSVPQMRLLRSYVEDLGGGFVMMGGENSFGLGGYFRTEVEGLLPVRMKAEKQRQDPSLAMMLILDKSGSMSGMKIEMAKEAALATLELLQSQDYVGLISFDSQPYMVVEMQQARNKLGISQTIETLQAGGGTSIYPALEIGYETLAQAPAVFKHAVLLTDGQSQQGDYQGIVARMVSERITVSTVAVGEGADTELLENLARWGNGRFYFTADPYDIPQIFTKETMTATKSSLVEEPFLPQLFQPLPVVRGLDWTTAPYLLGYVVTTPKTTAEIGLVTERGDPLYATWRVGLGKAAAFTSDAKSRWAAEWLTWPGYNTFWAQLVRDVMRTSTQNSVASAECALAIDRGVGRIFVDTTDADGNFVNDLDTTSQLIAPDLSLREIRLAQSAPGRYETVFDAEDTGSYLFKVHQAARDEMDGKAVPIADFTRGITVSYDPEYRHLGTNEALLRELALVTGGEFAPDIEAILTVDEDQAVAAYRPLWPWLVLAALLLFILDVALRRLDLAGWRVAGPPTRYG